MSQEPKDKLTPSPKDSLAGSASFRPGLRAGILGGGQLAQMLVADSVGMGLHPVVYAESAHDPAARLVGTPWIGALSDTERLGHFLSAVDLVIFENEFVRCDILRAAGGARSEALFRPGLATLESVRDKARQKELLAELGIPTAPFSRYPQQGEIAAWLTEATGPWGGQGMIKWGENGYDGKGVLPYRGNPRDPEVVTFCEQAIHRRVSLYVEAKVSFRRELAQVSCYSTRGEFRSYPLVESRQRNGVCEWVVGPATVSGAQADKAREFAEKLARSRNLFGCFAIEFFETEKGELWVNELAPRVHNTGHYTQDAAETSQFENHWRAVLGLPLGSTETAPGFVMRNLLGPPGISGPAANLALPLPTEKTFLHWYDKQEIRPGRKIGHLNGRVDATAEIPGLIQRLEKSHADWLARMKSSGGNSK